MIPFLSTIAEYYNTIAEHYIIALFLLANLAIGFWAHSKSKTNSFEDYALASRSLPTGVLVMTVLATVMSAGTLANTGDFFYYGVLGTLRYFATFIGFLFVGTFIAPYLVHFNNAITIGDLIHRFYGRFAQLITGIIAAFSCLLMISSQMTAIGGTGEQLLNIPYITTVLFFGGTVVLYSVWGGMRSVSYTDVLQGIAALVVLSWVAQTIVQKVGGEQSLLHTLSTEHPEKLALFSHSQFFYKTKSSLFWSVFCFKSVFSPPIVQRMLVTQDKRQVRKVWYISGILYAIIVSMLLFIGLAAIVGQGEKGIFDQAEYLRSLQKAVSLKVTAGDFQGIFPYLIKRVFKETWVYNLIFLGISGILLSTIDSYLHAVGVLLVQDIIGPIRALCGFKALPSKKKGTYARIGVIVIGILSLIVGCRQGITKSWDDSFYEYSLLVYALVIIPLILGTVGLKTDKISWVSFCSVYLFTVIGLRSAGWHKHESFIIAVLLGIMAFLFTHIIKNGGILMLKRSEQTISEQLWIPNWQGSVEYLKSWLLAPFRLHILASRKIVNNPTQSLSFSMLIFALYTFSSVMTGGSSDAGIANFMAGVHLVGITLCVGLMLEGIWPDRLKPYFALYWFCTLFYCLAFGSTLAFLREHGNMMAVIKWIVNFLFLLVLVDSMSFITLTCLGSSLAIGVWYALFRSIPADLLGSIGLPGIYLLAGLLVAVLLFVSSKEQHVNQRFNWNRTASSALGHDLRLTVGMLEGVGRTLENAFKASESITNTKGEKGYWVPEGQATFLGSFSEKMIERGAMAGKEIQDFSDFIKSQVVGIFEQKKTSMRAAAEEAVHKLEDKMPPTVEMKVSGKKDFSPKVLSGVFTNVFYNLLWNAATHGKASKMEILIDGDKRTVTVRDNGRGIPSDILPRIFDLNFSTEMKHTKNAGVGLAFVKMVIAASSGKISCHSRHGDKDSFTAFVMEFPEV